MCDIRKKIDYKHEDEDIDGLHIQELKTFKTFDIDVFLSLPSSESKIEYLDSCGESTIILTGVEGTKYNKLLFWHDRSVYFALCKKKFNCNGITIFSICCNNFKSDFQFIKTILEIYEKNNWLTVDTDEGTIIHELFSYSDSIYPRDEELFDYVTELYDRVNIPINIIKNELDTLECVARKGSINNFLRLLKLYKTRNLHIKDVFVQFIRRQYYSKQNTQLMNELVDFCIKNNIDVTNAHNINNEFHSHETIDVPYHLSSCISDWSILKKVIVCYLDKNIPINTDNRLLVNIGRNFEIEAVKFMIDYCEKNKQDIHAYPLPDFYYDTMNFTDAIIFSNSVEVLQYILSLGIIPKNNVIKLYVPCNECYNGESHSCNFRNVTTEYISLSRYEVTLDKLHTITENKPARRISYYEFSGPAKENEVYTEPGVDVLEVSDNDSEDNSIQYTFEIPPKKILLTQK